MKLTSDPKRIEKAHDILQRLEDEIVGSMAPVDSKTSDEVNKIYCKRLDILHDKVWKAIKCLNEAYENDI